MLKDAVFWVSNDVTGVAEYGWIEYGGKRSYRYALFLVPKRNICMYVQIYKNNIIKLISEVVNLYRNNKSKELHIQLQF